MTTQSIIKESEGLPANATLTSAKTKRYHPALVALHWLIALMIFGAFFLAQGSQGEGRGRFQPGQGNPPQQGAPSQNFQPGNPSPRNFPEAGSGGITSTIGFHMIFGLSILVLLIARLMVRFTTKHPEWASAGNKFFDWVGNLTHWGLYLLTFAMTITGIILANQRGILARTFGIGSTSAQGNFGRGGGFSLGSFHGGVWALLSLLILLHVGAALYHQFILKDNLLGRMWFGKRTE
jgi:cytochrome b561